MIKIGMPVRIRNKMKAGARVYASDSVLEQQNAGDDRRRQEERKIENVDRVGRQARVDHALRCFAREQSRHILRQPQQSKKNAGDDEEPGSLL